MKLCICRKRRGRWRRGTTRVGASGTARRHRHLHRYAQRWRPFVHHKSLGEASPGQKSQSKRNKKYRPILSRQHTRRDDPFTYSNYVTKFFPYIRVPSIAFLSSSIFLNYCLFLIYFLFVFNFWMGFFLFKLFNFYIQWSMFGSKCVLVLFRGLEIEESFYLKVFKDYGGISILVCF